MVGNRDGIGVYGAVVVPAQQHGIVHYCGSTFLPFLGMVDFADLASSIAVWVAAGSVARQYRFGLGSREGSLGPRSV